MTTLENLENARKNLVKAAQDHYDRIGYKILILDYAPGWTMEEPESADVILPEKTLERLKLFLEPRYSIVENSIGES